MGRPRKEIDPGLVLKLAERFCSRREVAAVVGCDEKTIRNRFSAEYEKGMEQGRTLLRELQWKSAKNGNVAMLIWLGKQYLGQKDRHEIETHGDNRLEITETIRTTRQPVEATGNGNGNGEYGTAPGAGRLPG